MCEQDQEKLTASRDLTETKKQKQKKKKRKDKQGYD